MSVEINLIYLPQKGIDKVYEDENGTVQRSKGKEPGKINISLGYLANRKPSGTDSILCLEPRCVTPLDYNMEIKKFFKIFSWCQPAMDFVPSKKLHIINHPFWNKPPEFRSLVRPKWSERKGFVIVSNNKTSNHFSQIYDIRIKIADYLHAKKCDVSWYGQDPIDRPYYKGPAKNKLEILRKARFCICPENCYDPVYSHGYFSEKMPDAWFAGCVPLYMGCYNIDDFKFPKESYLDLRPFVEKSHSRTKIWYSKLFSAVSSYTEDDYLKMIHASNEIMNRENGLYNIISNERAYSTIIKAFL